MEILDRIINLSSGDTDNSNDLPLAPYKLLDGFGRLVDASNDALPTNFNSEKAFVGAYPHVKYKVLFNNEFVYFKVSLIKVAAWYANTRKIVNCYSDFGLFGLPARNMINKP